MKKEFNVGDRVKVIKNFAGIDLKGKTGTIIDIKESSPYDCTVEFDEPFTLGHSGGGTGKEKCCRYGCFKELEHITSSYRITIDAYGQKVVAKLHKDDKVIDTAVAKCSPEDEFNFEYGARLALRRLTAPKVGDKVKIIADCCSHNFKNGTILTIDSVEETTTMYRCHPKENKRIWITEYDFVKCSEEDTLYNGKVVCVETSCPILLTVGKIYTFKDGKLIYDDGVITTGTYKSFEDVQESFESKFIEVVE